jgi:hypothetical protein
MHLLPYCICADYILITSDIWRLLYNTWKGDEGEQKQSKQLKKKRKLWEDAAAWEKLKTCMLVTTISTHPTISYFIFWDWAALLVLSPWNDMDQKLKLKENWRQYTKETIIFTKNDNFIIEKYLTWKSYIFNPELFI